MKVKAFLCGFLIMVLLAGCAANDVPETSEQAQETILYADHGVEISRGGDDCVLLVVRDASGAVAHTISIAPDGTILSDERTDRVYDSEGRVLQERRYTDGILWSEENYEIGADGQPVLIKSAAYQESGVYSVEEYDFCGNVVRMTDFDAAGRITGQTQSEYSLNQDGESYESRHVEVRENGEKFVLAYNEHGDTTLQETYDADGKLAAQASWEYGYGTGDEEVWQKKYENGILIFEIISYAEMDRDGVSVRYPETSIYYQKDGNRLVEFRGPNGEPAMVTLYNADGSEAYVHIYTYETFGNGCWKNIRVHDGDRLMREMVYQLNAEGTASYLAELTEYHEDGSRTVTEYNENQEIIFMTDYPPVVDEI